MRSQERSRWFFGLVQFTVTLSIVVVVIVIETADWLYKLIDYDNRFADNDNEGGRHTGTHASMVLNQAGFLILCPNMKSERAQDRAYSFSSQA